jgi:hypothetical protein
MRYDDIWVEIVTKKVIPERTMRNLLIILDGMLLYQSISSDITKENTNYDAGDHRLGQVKEHKLRSGRPPY